MERITAHDLEVLSVSRLEHYHRYLCAASVASDAVLDVACGVGYGAEILLQSSSVKKYIGVDVDPGSVRQASANQYNNADFLVSSATALPFPEGKEPPGSGASQHPLTEDFGIRLGVLSIGGSYFSALSDGLVSAEIVNQRITRIIKIK